MDAAYLRSATRAEHEATEALMPLTGEGVARAVYLATLEKMYPLIAGWEQFGAVHASAELKPLVGARQRSPLLERDIRALGGSWPIAARFPADRISGLAEHRAAAFIGAMYVIEGSTLGGQYIARHLEPTLGLSPQTGTAYFRGYGENTGAMWQQFKAEIAKVPDEEAEQVVAAARATFNVFADALRG